MIANNRSNIISSLIKESNCWIASNTKIGSELMPSISSLSIWIISRVFKTIAIEINLFFTLSIKFYRIIILIDKGTYISISKGVFVEEFTRSTPACIYVNYDFFGV